MTNKEQTTQAAEQVTEQANEFNYFDYFKFNVLSAYYEALLNGENTNEFEFDLKGYDRNKSVYFYKSGVLKFGKITTTYDEDGRVFNHIEVKDFNPDVKAISKQGKEYSVFSTLDHGKAIKAARKMLKQA